MRFFGALVLLGVLVAVSAAGAAQRVQLMTAPCPSPDGKWITFNWHDDIWVVSARGGVARAVTRHPAADFRPVYSPNGRWIAFASTRGGGADVYVVDARGGVPRQITFHSAYDVPMDWTRDGKHVLFISSRDVSYPRNYQLYTVDLKGAAAERVTVSGGDQGRYTHDGKRLLYIRNSGRWWRQGYRGSGNADLWISDADGSNNRRLIPNDGPESSPMPAPGGKRFYFVAEVGGKRAALFEATVAAGKPKKLADVPTFPIRHGRISRNGRLISFLAGGDLWTYDLRARKTRKLRVTARADATVDSVSRENFTRGATEYLISPDGKQLITVVRGEIFASYTDGTSTRRLTETPALDNDIFWGPKHKKVLFVSDRNGFNTELFTVESADKQREDLALTLKLKTEQLTKSGRTHSGVTYSPDGKWLVGWRDRDLVVMDAKTRKPRTVVKGPYCYGYDYSPDSKWLLYEKSDAHQGRDLYVEAIDGSVGPVNITDYRTGNGDPNWSRDGKFIVFTAHRNGTWKLYRLELRRSIPDEVYGLDKPKKEKKPTTKPATGPASQPATRPATQPASQPATQPATQPASKPTTRPASKPVKKTEKKKDDAWKKAIDFDRITERAERIASLAGDIWSASLSPDGKRVAFVSDTYGGNDLWAVATDGGTPRRLTTGSLSPRQIQWSASSRTIYFLDRSGFVRKVSATGGSTSNVGYAARMDIDIREELLEMFRQSWWALRKYFYDPKFHGLDWKALRRRYEPLSKVATNKTEAMLVIQMMMGELNASHMGVWGSGGSSSGPTTGSLGLAIEREPKLAGIRITGVLPHGPCDRRGVDIKAGEVLTAIEGEKLNARTNLARLLNDRVGKLTRIEIATETKGKLTGRRGVTVKPVSSRSFTGTLYRLWAERNAERVDKLSDGKLAYAHIAQMDDSSLERFQRQLYGRNFYRKALVLDVRFNGGGHTHDRVLNLLRGLDATRYVPRDGKSGSVLRRWDRKWSRPVILLINEHSFSDAEICAHEFRAYGLGKLVGMPTAGGVIGTWSYTLIDGSTLRMPSLGVWTSAGANLENTGVRPDVRVENHPDALAAGRDQQLAEAVKVLLEQIARKKDD